MRERERERVGEGGGERDRQREFDACTCINLAMKTMQQIRPVLPPAIGTMH